MRLFNGTRSFVELIDYKGKQAILKQLRPGKPDTLVKEAKILKSLDRYVPKLYESGPGYIIMEYIDGISLKQALARDPKRAIRLALEACYYLDRMGVYHKELGRYHHLLYGPRLEWVRVIDFERSVLRPDARNVLQFAGFYLRDYDLAEALTLYKRNKKAGFAAILEVVGV